MPRPVERAEQAGYGFDAYSPLFPDVQATPRPDYTYLSLLFDMEGQFTQAGSRLLDSGQLQEGVFVFKLVTDLYPESAYAWNNLADGLNKAGMTQEAIATYQKVAEMAQGTLLGRGAAQKAEALSDQK